MSVSDIIADLKALYAEKNCGPIMIRLSWHDAGVYSAGAKTGGCPNAAMRFTDGGEGCFGANAGELMVYVPVGFCVVEQFCC
jgi:L-ascorbate peroxidase